MMVAKASKPLLFYHFQSKTAWEIKKRKGTNYSVKVPKTNVCIHIYYTHIMETGLLTKNAAADPLVEVTRSQVRPHPTCFVSRQTSGEEDFNFSTQLQSFHISVKVRK